MKPQRCHRGRTGRLPEGFGVIPGKPSAIPDQMHDTRAGLGGNVRELRFLLGSERDFHANRILFKFNRDRLICGSWRDASKKR